jgi:hypothetical protein
MDASINPTKESRLGNGGLPGLMPAIDAFRGRGTIMKRFYRAGAVLLAVALVPGIAHARGYGRSGGYVNTPFGSFPMSTMNMAGGNPLMASDLQQQQMMYQQQQAWMKQQQQYMQQMQKMQKAGQNPSGTMQSTTGAGQGGSTPTIFTANSKKKKKTTATSTSKSAASKKAETTPAKTAATGEKAESN